MPSRRSFLRLTPALTVGALSSQPSPAASPMPASSLTDVMSLCGEWRFATDPANEGEQASWFSAMPSSTPNWRTVSVPHTWQIEEPLADYRAAAWYIREFPAEGDWQTSQVRIEFEAVFHSARVWINGQFAGEHLRRGYTAFAVDASQFLHYDKPNLLAVRVDNSFDEHMLPRGRSSDWAHDGGIYRPVQLLVTPKAYIERLEIDAVPDFASGNATVNATVVVRNAGTEARRGNLFLRIVEEETGKMALEQAVQTAASVDAGASQAVHMAATLKDPRLWHFDHPHLYRAEVSFGVAGVSTHSAESAFGIRKLETRGVNFYLNNERVTLMGVERMAGSNPEFGMAEPAHWIEHDHDDLRNLSCIFTRVHWQQDRRVLDYCDRHGILIQSEVPTWGPNTFRNMGEHCDADIMENGREQLREMIARDRNHPSIVSWGLCNEIGGQNPPAYDFAKNMLAEAKRLDPDRLCSYASNSLFKTPGKDVAALMDFVECNEYYGSWSPGTPETLSTTMDEIAAEIPDKPIVISEYGYCACTADRPEGDQRRDEILQTHTAVLREKPYVAGLIFFCYNDYRTHIGDRGLGVMRQRVHGVVDVYGNRKPSYDLLRAESSPIASLQVEGKPKDFTVTITNRKTIPAYRLTGYRLRALYFGYGEIPIERKEQGIPSLEPGVTATLHISFSAGEPLHVQFDVLRPGGESAYSLEWKS